ncbi:MAG: RNA polymerase sigma factor [Anaerolineae bacterium]
MSDETSLLEAARKGNPEALGQIFDTYAPALFRYAVRLCHDPAEADRIVGDVFAQLLDQLSSGRGPRTNLRSYLYQIAYHVLVDHVRDASHVSSMDEALNLPDGVQSVAAQVEEQEMLRELEYAVAHGLTGEQQHVIMLRFVEGFSLQETADITGKKVNAVSVLQNRAITKLRQLLGTKYGVG